MASQLISASSSTFECKRRATKVPAGDQQLMKQWKSSTMLWQQ
jgi:hypothetical protein